MGMRLGIPDTISQAMYGGYHQPLQCMKDTITIIQLNPCVIRQACLHAYYTSITSKLVSMIILGLHVWEAMTKDS